MGIIGWSFNEESFGDLPEIKAASINMGCTRTTVKNRLRVITVCPNFSI